MDIEYIQVPYQEKDEAKALGGVLAGIESDALGLLPKA